jgi:hypothetical protein
MGFEDQFIFTLDIAKLISLQSTVVSLTSTPPPRSKAGEPGSSFYMPQ